MEGNRKDGHTLPSPSLSLFDEERKRINTILLLYALEQLGDQRIGFELTDIIHKTFPNRSEWSVEHTCLQRQDFLWESLVLCWQTKEMKNKEENVHGTALQSNLPFDDPWVYSFSPEYV